MTKIWNKIISYFNKTNISIFLASVLIILVFHFLYQDTSLTNEDYFLPFLDNKNEGSAFKEIFFSSDHMWYLLSMFNALTLRFMPVYFDIHPQVFMSQYVVYFLIGIFLIFIFAVCNAYSKYNSEKTPFYAVLMLITTYLTVYFLYKAKLLWIFYNATWAYSYVLIPSIAFVLWSRLEYFYVQKVPFTKKDWVIILSLIFLVGISHEMYKTVLCLSLPIGFLLDKLIFNKKYEVNEIKKYLKMYILVFIFCSFNCFSSEMLYKINYFYRPYAETQFFVEFSKYFCEVIRFFTIKNVPMLISLLVLIECIVNFVKDKEKNKRYFLFNAVFCFSLFIFLMGLFLAQKSYLQDGISFILYHPGICFNLRIIYLMLIFSACGYLYTFAKDEYKVYVKSLFTVGIIMVISICLVHKQAFWDTLIHEQSYKVEIKKSTYVLEKCFLTTKFDREENKFYNYYTSSLYTDNALKYYLNLYGAAKTGDYVTIDVCSTKDSLYFCRKKLIETVGCHFNAGELEDVDFNDLYKYSIIKDRR